MRAAGLARHAAARSGTAGRRPGLVRFRARSFFDLCDMQPYSNCGWIEMIVGPMHSGKSTELRRRLATARRAGVPVVLYQALAPSSAPPQKSWDGAVFIHSSDEIIEHLPEGVEVVAINEAHFLDAGLANVAEALTGHGIRVVIAGIDTDFRGETFGVIGDLLAQAEQLLKLQAVCVQCGGAGTRTQRLIGGRPVDSDAPTVDVDERVVYEPRCRACHMVPEPTR
jgi:thymidine kinase